MDAALERAAGLPLLATPSYDVGGGEGPLQTVRSMPETAAIAQLLAALAPHLHMTPLPVTAIEEALAEPAAHAHTLSILFSRVLIRDTALRGKLPLGEGIEWEWAADMIRQTVRAWYMRRAAVAKLVDALMEASRADAAAAAAEKAAEASAGGRASRSAGGGGNATLQGPFQGDWMPRKPYTTAYDPNDYDSAAALRQRRGEDPRPRLAVLRAAAAAAAPPPVPAAAPEVADVAGQVAATDDAGADDEREGDSVSGDGAHAGQKRRRQDVDGVDGVDVMEPALVPRPLPVEASTSVGTQLSNSGIATGAAVAAERREAVTAAANQGISYAAYATRRALRRAEAARASPDVEAGVDAGEEEDLGPLRQEELVHALVDMSEEADELEVAELMDWDTLLERLGGPTVDPLAHQEWADAPPRMRVLILYAMLDVRCTRENDGVSMQIARGNVSADALRLHPLGSDSEGTSYFTFADGYSEDMPRVYTQAVASATPHGTVYRWRVAATGVDEVRALIAARHSVASSLTKNGAKLALEVELQEQLQQMLQAVSDAAAAAATKATREARRKRAQDAQAATKVRTIATDGAPASMEESMPTAATDSSSVAAVAANGSDVAVAAAEATQEEEAPLVVTYGEDVGIPILDMQRTRALAMIDLMTNPADVARAVVDLLAAAPEHERYIGMPASPRPLRTIPKALREATQSEFETQYDKVRKRRARAMKDRERARKERESAGERQEAAARREEERKRKEEAIAREREARAARRMLGLSVTAAPGFAVDPRRYLPSYIRIPLKLLWRKCDDETELKRLADIAADHPTTLYDGHGYVKVLGDPQPRDAASGNILPMRVHAFAPESVDDIVATRGETRQCYWSVDQPSELISPPIVFEPPADRGDDDMVDATVTAHQAAPTADEEDAEEVDADGNEEAGEEEEYDDGPAPRKRSRSRSRAGRGRRRPSGSAGAKRSRNSAASKPPSEGDAAPLAAGPAAATEGAATSNGDVTSSGRKRRPSTKRVAADDSEAAAAAAAAAASAPAAASRARPSSAKRPRKKARKSNSAEDADDAGEDDSPYQLPSSRPSARAASRSRRAGPRSATATQESLSELLPPAPAPQQQYAMPQYGLMRPYSQEHPEGHPAATAAWGNATMYAAAHMHAMQMQQAVGFPFMAMHGGWPAPPPTFGVPNGVMLAPSPLRQSSVTSSVGQPVQSPSVAAGAAEL